MNKIFMAVGFIGACLLGNAAVADDASRATVHTNYVTTANNNLRGQKNSVNAYMQNQRNTYFMVA